MSQLTITAIRFGLLALLWVFVFSIVGVLRSDLYGSAVPRRRRRKAKAKQADTYQTPPSGHRPVAPPPVPASSGAPGTLTVTSGALAGTSVPLRAAGVVIGRAPECSLVLTDDYASGRHVKVYATAQGWLVEDLGSTNGTLLDDVTLPPHDPAPIRPGSVLTIGRTSIELRG